MATYTTYTQIGQAEDVSDIITQISPTQTPFISSIRSGRANARLCEWQEDNLRRVIDNAAVEGADASSATLTPTVLRTNYTQILQKAIKISGTSDAVRTYGRARETAYQIRQAMKELKRELEYACVGFDKNAAVGDASSNPRKFGNVHGQDAGSTAMVTNTKAGTATTGSALSEANLLDLHEDIYNDGGEPTILLVNPANAVTVSTFAEITDKRIRDRGNDTRLVNVVDVYVSPFGELSVVKDRFMKQFIADAATPPKTQIDPASDTDSDPDQLGAALLYDPNMWELAALRPWFRKRLGDVGDSEQHQMIGEYTLKHMNYEASGLLTNLNAD